MLERLCEPEHLIIIILVLLAALLVVGAGKGGGKLLLQLLKRVFGHEEVNINLGGGDMPGKPTKEMCTTCGVFTDPSKCPLHEAEHERSMRNEKGIGELAGELKNTREKLWGKLDGMDGTLTDIKVAVAKLVVESKYQQKGRGGGGS